MPCVTLKVGFQAELWHAGASKECMKLLLIIVLCNTGRHTCGVLCYGPLVDTFAGHCAMCR